MKTFFLVHTKSTYLFLKWNRYPIGYLFKSMSRPVKARRMPASLSVYVVWWGYDSILSVTTQHKSGAAKQASKGGVWLIWIWYDDVDRYIYDLEEFYNCLLGGSWWVPMDISGQVGLPTSSDWGLLPCAPLENGAWYIYSRLYRCDATFPSVNRKPKRQVIM